MDYPTDDPAEQDDEPDSQRSSVAEPTENGSKRNGDAREGGPGGQEPPSRPGAVNRILLVALGTAVLAIIVLLVAVVQISADRDDLSAENRKESDARTTAQEFLTAFFNFDWQTIDEDFDRILTFTTGEFDQEVDSFRDPAVRTGLRDRQVQSRGEIVDLWVQSIEGDRARLFAVVDNTLQNNVQGVVVDEIRMEVGLVREDGRWKVFDVGILPASGSLGAGGLTPLPTETPSDTTTTSAPGG